MLLVQQTNNNRPIIRQHVVSPADQQQTDKMWQFTCDEPETVESHDLVRWKTRTFGQRTAETQRNFPSSPTLASGKRGHVRKCSENA